MTLKKPHKIILAILSGIILSFGWYAKFTGLFVLTGFIPLLFIEDDLDKNKNEHRSIRFFFYSFISFFVWNILNTWWILNATFFGCTVVIIYNSLIMSVVMWLFHISKRTLGASIGYFCFIIFWLAFEKYTLSSELSWPWLHLGNAFANDIKIIQWYEYSGVHGGSLWILIINLLLFKIIRSYISIGNIKKALSNIFLVLIIIIIPVIISLIKFNTYKEDEESINITLIQPNIDPYNNTSTELTKTDIFNIITNMIKESVDSTTDYVIIPEAEIQNTIIESQIDSNKCIVDLKAIINKYPKLHIISGIYSYKYYTKKERTITASKFYGDSIYYDVFNSAIQINNTDTIYIYHKSKLVLGVEKMPFPKIISKLDILIEQLGGFSASLGTQKERSVFTNKNKKILFAPVICYESDYGEFVTDYIKKGANAIAVMTNDGWWGDTPGYKQHLSFSRIRAIENRRSIVRSASTGVSAIIDQKGEIISNTNYGERKALKGKINTNTSLTFYSKHGDFIGRSAIFFSIIMLLYTLTMSIVKDKRDFMS